ncbi:Hypothetical_protein [Hexamita inflata]|uniref:Hypothetical_protein n=1 Tax=Hexamita inflata TaxID=28002 RepID=A0AA86UVN8_9EUKA|nr:Hypothetical protein HINF_LOCUS54136 [Hexamita inflata]
MSLQDLVIVGYNFYENSESSNIINQIESFVEQTVNISNIKICSNIQHLINGGAVSSVTLTQQPIYTCDDICGSLIPVYGICQIDLINGYLNNVNKTKYCEYPFIFNGYECICSQGYLLKETLCINILSKLTSLDQQIFNNISTLNLNLQNNVSNISKYITEIQQQISSINAVNIAQSADITMLKNQQTEISASGAQQICLIVYGIGYCTSVNRCCYQCNSRSCSYRSNYFCNSLGEISAGSCGTFIG